MRKASAEGFMPALRVERSCTQLRAASNLKKSLCKLATWSSLSSCDSSKTAVVSSDGKLALKLTNDPVYLVVRA